jgi:hypothetical protein
MIKFNAAAPSDAMATRRKTPRAPSAAAAGRSGLLRAESAIGNFGAASRLGAEQ